MFFNGHEIGVKAVDKYENYHPVVWMTANDRAGAKNTGLSNDKIMCRITIKTEGKIWRYLPWRAFYDKYNADRSIASTLKQTADDYRNWYVRESEIPVEDFAKVEFLAEDGTYKAENDIPGFSLSDVAPELLIKEPSDMYRTPASVGLTGVLLLCTYSSILFLRFSCWSCFAVCSCSLISPMA